MQEARTNAILDNRKCQIRESDRKNAVLPDPAEGSVEKEIEKRGEEGIITMKKRLAFLLATVMLLVGIPAGVLSVSAENNAFEITSPTEGQTMDINGFDLTFDQKYDADEVESCTVSVKNADTGKYAKEMAEVTGGKIHISSAELIKAGGAGNYVAMVRVNMKRGDPNFSSLRSFKVDGTVIGREYHFNGATVVSYGDSLVANGWENDWDDVWSTLLWDRFGFTQIVNAGVPGNTSTQGLARFEKDVASVTGADFVLILFGMNDHAIPMGGTAPQVDIDTYKLNLSAMADKVAAMGAKPVFVTMSYVDEEVYKERHPEEFLPPYTGAQNLIDTYSQAMREVAAQKGADLIDMAAACQAYDKAEFLQADGTHLAAGGQEAYAKTIGDYMAEKYPGGEKKGQRPSAPTNPDITIPEGGFDLMPQEGVTTSPEGMYGSNGKLVPTYNADGTVTLTNQSDKSWPAIKTEYGQMVDFNENPYLYYSLSGLDSTRHDGYNLRISLDGNELVLSDILGLTDDIRDNGTFVVNMRQYLLVNNLLSEDGTAVLDYTVMTYATWAAGDVSITLNALKFAPEKSDEPTGSATEPTPTGTDPVGTETTGTDSTGTVPTGTGGATDTTGTTASTTAPAKGDNPKTGDNTLPLLAGTLLLTGSAAALFLTRKASRTR